MLPLMWKAVCDDNYVAHEGIPVEQQIQSMNQPRPEVARSAKLSCYFFEDSCSHLRLFNSAQVLMRLCSYARYSLLHGNEHLISHVEPKHAEFYNADESDCLTLGHSQSNIA